LCNNETVTEYRSNPESETMAANTKPGIAAIHFYLISAVCIIALIVALVGIRPRQVRVENLRG
jgi:hypothetical protein